MDGSIMISQLHWEVYFAITKTKVIADGVDLLTFSSDWSWSVDEFYSEGLCRFKFHQ